MMSEKGTIQEVCGALLRIGHDNLAERLVYLASDEDLEPGEFPVTLESAKGFLGFHLSVESEGEVGLACSPDGWVCAEWRFPDERIVGIWFLDADRVIFSATDKNGEFVNIKERNKVTECSKLMQALVREELFVWRPGE
jgi:hypothetical protein